MNDIFFKKKVVDYDILLDMKEDMDGKISDAGVIRSDYRGNDPNIRSTKLKDYIKPRNYPDICEQLHTIVEASGILNTVITYNGIIQSDLKVNEFNYLIYEVGDHFSRHRDFLTSESRDKGKKGKILHPQRYLSTSTLISESSDFEGGELILFDDNDNEIDPKLEVGETIIFNSIVPHQVKPVTKGTREVLVAWFGLVQEINDFEQALIRFNLEKKQ
jgi:hypothetical protein